MTEFKVTFDKFDRENELEYEQSKIKLGLNEERFKYLLSLCNDYPKLKYYSRNESQKELIIHHGQRKLLLSEIRFITKYGHLSDNIIYAGSAPGHHIKYLSLLFPKHIFYLYDPNPFKINETSNIKIFNEYFTKKLSNEITNKFKNNNFLFISDIRTADYRHMTHIENEKCIDKDNQWQYEWIKIMKPIVSMIKFRLPYPDVIKGSTKYFKGIYVTVFI